MGENICVYCSSSNAVDKRFFQKAHESGCAIAQKGYGLVYGGTSVGLMGEVARATHSNGGRVIGIIPEKINDFGIAFDHEIETIITKTMRERKHAMEENSSFFIAMPGGFGTLEEMSEMIVSKQLGYHNKALIFYNIDGYYEPLFEFFANFYKDKFAKEGCKDLFYCANTIEEIFDYIENYSDTREHIQWKEKYFYSL